MSRSLRRYLRFALCVVFRQGRSVSTKPPVNPSSKRRGGRCMSDGSTPEVVPPNESKWSEDVRAGAIGEPDGVRFG